MSDSHYHNILLLFVIKKIKFNWTCWDLCYLLNEWKCKYHRNFKYGIKNQCSIIVY